MVFAPHYPAQPAQLEGPGLVVDDPHNLILNELVASGTVGLVAFLWVVAEFPGMTLAAFNGATDKEAEARAAAAVNLQRLMALMARGSGPRAAVEMV